MRAMKYLTEHVDEIVLAIRNARDLLAKPGASWETTAWTRSMADAARLAERLRESVFAEADRIDDCAEACVGLVRRNTGSRPEIRWGVLVRISRR